MAARRADFRASLQYRRHVCAGLLAPSKPLPGHDELQRCSCVTPSSPLPDRSVVGEVVLVSRTGWRDHPASGIHLDSAATLSYKPEPPQIPVDRTAEPALRGQPYLWPPILNRVVPDPHNSSTVSGYTQQETAMLQRPNPSFFTLDIPRRTDQTRVSRLLIGEVPTESGNPLTPNRCQSLCIVPAFGQKATCRSS